MIPATHILFNKEDRETIVNEVNEILLNGQLTLGKWTNYFEELFSDYNKGNENVYSVAVNSGTSALEILFRIYDLKNQEILIPTNTFFATALAAHHVGAKIRYVDNEEGKPWISLDEIKKCVTKYTKAVVVVHIGGIIIPDIVQIADFCKEKGIILIEDAAHAHGSKLNNKMAGTFGDAAAFSFYPTKVITSGEGGMILTKKESVAIEAKLYRDQGKESFYKNTHGKYGYNWRLPEINALLGFSQLKRLDEFIRLRNEVAITYNNALEGYSNISIIKPSIGSLSNYYKYIVYLNENIDINNLYAKLREKEIHLAGQVYSVPCHQQPIYSNNLDRQELPNSMDFSRKHICLPISPNISVEDANLVVNNLLFELNNISKEEQYL